MSTSINEKSAVKSKDDLPPPRDRQGLRPVSPPLSGMSFRRFTHYLGVVAVLLCALYAWRITVWKAEAGGWWNLALGRKMPMAQDTSSGGAPTMTQDAGAGDTSVEERIDALAAALGMPSKDLASAIASAVHAYVPPATLSSLAAHQTGDAVKYLVDPEGAAAADEEASAVAPMATKGFKAAAMAFEAAVGMDEPPSEMS